MPTIYSLRKNNRSFSLRCGVFFQDRRNPRQKIRAYFTCKNQITRTQLSLCLSIQSSPKTMRKCYFTLLVIMSNVRYCASYFSPSCASWVVTLYKFKCYFCSSIDHHSVRWIVCSCSVLTLSLGVFSAKFSRLSPFIITRQNGSLTAEMARLKKQVFVPGNFEISRI